MILTGTEIGAAVRHGRIWIDPFDEACLNPNSYNYHLGDTLLVSRARPRSIRRVRLGPEGYVLIPGIVYLGSTYESIGSDHFATLLLGRSSIGRLGVFLNITADLGHIGSRSHWTLEIVVVQAVRLYPRMKIGQVSFWLTDDHTPHRYDGRYHHDSKPVPNRDLALGRYRK